LEDEAISVQGPKGWCREKEIPQRSARICSGVVATDISPAPIPTKEWKKSKMKTEDLLALVNSRFLREKEMDVWRAAAGNMYPMEKPRRSPHVRQVRGARTSTPGQRFLQGAASVLWY
jgi:hypothetical protein